MSGENGGNVKLVEGSGVIQHRETLFEKILFTEWLHVGCLKKETIFTMDIYPIGTINYFNNVEGLVMESGTI